MRGLFSGALLLTALIVGTSTAAARPAESVALCRSVTVSGGDYNGMTGGVTVAHLIVKNSGRASCTLLGRPWIRIPAIPHAVRIDDITTKPVAGSERVVLTPGASASAQIWLNPGRCDRGKAVVFGLTARVGWQNKSVPVASDMCKDGSGRIDVGLFQRLGNR